MTTAPTTHPFEMYTAIHSQPKEVARLASAEAETIATLAQTIRDCRSVTIVGIGSSLHAAQIGTAVWREVLPHIPVRAIHSFDFVTDSMVRGELTPRDCVIALTHRGTKNYTLQALAIARESKVPTCIITGEERESAASNADTHLSTVPQERSSAHTVSLIGSLAALVVAIEQVTGISGQRLSSAILNVIEGAIAQEGAIQRLAARLSPNTRHIWLVGAGTDVVIARETALKIKETSYIPAEGMSVEEMLHGPFQCAEPQDLFILLDTQGTGSERIGTLREMAHTVGATVLSISNQQTSADGESEGAITVPPSDSPALRAVGALVALQLYTYFVAITRGANPDNFRLDDPRFKKASSLVRL